jgi:hypothetical protein
VGQTAYPTPNPSATFTQAATPPASAVLVTVPTTVALYRHVYGTIGLEVGNNATIEVERAVGSGTYDTVQFISIGATDETLSASFSFVVAPGRRYRFTLVGASIAIDYYAYMDV